MQLRDYQQVIVKNTIESLDTCFSVCIQAPTGAGKTLIIAALCQELKNKYQGYIICITTPRIEVVQQILNTVSNYDAALLSTCVFLTPQKMSNWIEKNSNIPFILFIDEAHHTPANTYTEIAKKSQKLIGLTATPLHNSKKNAMSQQYEKLIHGPLLSELVSGGYLSNPYVFTLPVDESMKLEKHNGMESAQRTFKANDTDVVYESIIDAYTHVCDIAGKELRTLVFAISREHGWKLNTEFQNAGIESDYLDSLSTKEKRKQIVDDFRSGRLRVMVNIDLFGEGFDAPGCDAVLMARPTESEIIFFQQCGRALRLAEGKEYGYIIDCAGNFQRILEAPGLLNRIYTFDSAESSGDVVGQASTKKSEKREIEESITSTERNEQEGEAYINDDEWNATQGVLDASYFARININKALKSNRKGGLKLYIQILRYCIDYKPNEEQFRKIINRVAQVNKYANGWVYYQIKDWMEHEKDFLKMYQRQKQKRDEYINAKKKERVALF